MSAAVMGEAQTFSPAEVAKRIVGSGEDTDLPLRRIRHLTLIGALDALGDPHSGPGRHRRYDPHAVRVAAVLNALMDGGVTVGRLKKAGVLLRSPEPRDLWERAIANTEEIFLVIGAGPVGLVREIPADSLHSADPITILNVTRVLGIPRAHDNYDAICRGALPDHGGATTGS